jgi:hypothetical protein
MRRALVLMWVGFVLPFVLTVINGGPDGWLPHVFFHPAYVAFLAVGVYGVHVLRGSTEARVLRRLGTVVAAVAAVAAVGHFGEFVAVLLGGGLHAGEEVFAAPLHLTSANVTVPMVVLAIVLTVATTVTAWVVTRDAPVGPAYHRGVRTVHRWSSLGFTIAVPLLFVAQDSPVTAALAVVTIVVLLLTGVQMSGRHYLVRWRRRRNRRDASGGQRVSSAGQTRTGNGRSSSSTSLPDARPAST